MIRDGVRVRVMFGVGLVWGILARLCPSVIFRKKNSSPGCDGKNAAIGEEGLIRRWYDKIILNTKTPIREITVPRYLSLDSSC